MATLLGSVTLTKKTGTVLTLNTDKKYVTDDVKFNLAVQAGEGAANSASADVDIESADGSAGGVNISSSIGEKQGSEPSEGYYIRAKASGSGSSKISTAGWMDKGNLTAASTTAVKYFPVTSGSVTSGTANITSLTKSYNSSSGKFDISGSANVSAPVIDTAGYVGSANETHAKNGGATVSASLDKIVGSTAITGTRTYKPSISKQNTPSGVTNAASGNATTTAPSSGVYVAVKAAGGTNTITATPSVTTEGYGTSSQHGIQGTTAPVGAADSDTTYVPITTTSASVDGRTVSYGSGWISQGSQSIDVGSITSAAATINTINVAYNSGNGNFDVTGSKAIGAPNVDTAGYISTTEGTKNGNTATLAATVAKIAGSTTVNSNASGTSTVTLTKKPSISKQSVPSGVTDAASGSATTSAPSSGVYVAVKAGASTAKFSATPSVTTAGYGNATNHGLTGVVGTYGASDSDTTYVPITTTSAAVDGKNVTYGTGWITGATQTVDDVVGSIGGTPTAGKATAAISNTNNMATIDSPSGTAGTDYWEVKATASGTAGGYTPKYTVTTPGWIAETVTGSKASVSVTGDSTGKSIYVKKAAIAGSSTNATATTTVAPGDVTIAKQAITTSGVTDAASGDAITDPSSGVYVAVKATAAANTTGTTSSISGSGTATVSTAGYAPASLTGSVTVSGTATAKTSQKQSSVYYVPITTATAAVNGDTVTYGTGWITGGSKTVAAGSATTPTTSITANPSISVSAGGLITATVSGSKSITPTVEEGYVTAGTAGTVSVTGSKTQQLTVQAAQTITPGTSNKTIAANTYLTGTQTIAGDADLVAANIKKGVEIFGVTGTFTTTPSGKTALAASALRSGYAGFINGNQVNGSMPDTTVTEGTTSVSGSTATRGTWSQTAGYTADRTIGAATFSSTATDSVDYVDISGTTSAPALVSGSYLFINKGYVDNLKISLAKLVPDDSSAGADTTSASMLNGYTAYNNDGQIITGSIPDLTSTDVTVNASTNVITIPAGKYTTGTAITKSMSNSTYYATATQTAAGAITPSVGLDSAATNSYGFTTTKPSGTTGTNFLTVDPGGSVATKWKVTPKAFVSVAGYAALNTSGTAGTALEGSPTINAGTNYYVPIVTATVAGGDLSTTTNTNTVGTIPVVTVSSSGTFKSATTYGVTTTKPSGTDGTNYLTIDGAGEVTTTGKATSTVKVTRADVTLNNSAGAIAANSNVVKIASGDSGNITKDVNITPNITDSFDPLYIPIRTVSFGGGTVSKTDFSKADLALTLADDSTTTNITNYTVGAQDTTNYPYYVKVDGSTPAVSGTTNVSVTKRTYSVSAGAIAAVSGGTALSAVNQSPSVSVNATSGSTYVGLKKAAVSVTGTNTVSPTASVAGASNVVLTNTTNNGISITATGGGTASVTATATTSSTGYAPASTSLGSATLAADSNTTTATKYIYQINVPKTKAFTVTTTANTGSDSSVLTVTNNAYRKVTLTNAANGTATITNNGTIDSLTNAGTITAITNNASKTITNIANSGTAKVTSGSATAGTLTVNAYNNASTPALTGEKTVVSAGKWNMPSVTAGGTYYGMVVVPSGSASSSFANTGISTYFNSGSSSSNSISITPRHTIGTAGYLAAATNVAGTTSYYTIKTASPTFTAAPTGGSTATGTNCTINTTNNSGVSVQTKYSINAVDIKYNAAATGWIDKAANADTGSDTTAKSSTNGTLYYINGVTLVKNTSANRTFSVVAPDAAGTNHTYLFTVDTSGNTSIKVDNTLTMQWNTTDESMDFIYT